MNGDLVGVIRRATAEVLGDVVEGLRAAVRIPSVNPAVDRGGGETAIQEFIAGEMERSGCRVEMWEPDAGALVDRFPGFRVSPRPEGYRGRPNVIGWLPSSDPPEGSRAHLILNSHADTVAPGDAAAWRHPPFAAALEGGAVCGLGAADAKGCLLMFLGAVMALRRGGIVLRRSVMVQSVVDEEWGGAGVLECIRRGYEAHVALVGEPTGLGVCPASRGAASLHLRVVGRRAHPGEGWRGVNAIRKAWLYIEALDRLRDELDRTKMHPLWAPLPAGHVWNLMGITAGPTEAAARSVPDLCDVNYGIGMIGDERAAAIEPLVEAALSAVTAGDPWLAEHPPTVTWRPGFEPAVTDPRHPAVRLLAEAIDDLGHGPAMVQAFSAASDGRHLINEGRIPAINFGPGELHRAHSPMEELPVEDLRRAIETVALFMVRHCGTVGSG